MITHSADGSQLVVLNFDSIELTTFGQLSPRAILVTAWNSEKSSILPWEKFLIPLIRRGAGYIICVGEFSEQLHDNIDDMLFRIHDQSEFKNCLNIATTFHKCIDDAICFFKNATRVQGNNDNLLAILDENFNQDVELKKKLLQV